MNAILVCVDFADLLAITLPYNRHHFGRVMVVTTPDDRQTVRVAEENGAETYRTDSFYTGGADFNKWVALEEGLDVLGRDGWLCTMDADVLWPKDVDIHEFKDGSDLHMRRNDNLRNNCTMKTGSLCTPLRRMLEDWQEYAGSPVEPNRLLVDEENWSLFPLHPQQHEFAGYTQIFHADDPALGPSPWHETNWRHAGGADSFFQAKWPEDKKIRPPFEVLHLGPAGQNWCGRVTPYMDGSRHSASSDRYNKVRDYVRGRKRGAGRFDHERLS